MGSRRGVEVESDEYWSGSRVYCDLLAGWIVEKRPLVNRDVLALRGFGDKLGEERLER